jgi:hypothetical protein
MGLAGFRHPLQTFVRLRQDLDSLPGWVGGGELAAACGLYIDSGGIKRLHFFYLSLGAHFFIEEITFATYSLQIHLIFYEPIEPTKNHWSFTFTAS